MSENRKVRELIPLVYIDEDLIGQTRVPFAFLMCSPEEVVTVRIREKYLADLLGNVTHTEIEESLAMIVSALCSDLRKPQKDIETVLDLTEGFSSIKVNGPKEVNLTDQEKLQMLLDTSFNLVMSFFGCFNSNTQNLEDVFAEWSQKLPVETESKEKGEPMPA